MPLNRKKISLETILNVLGLGKPTVIRCHTSKLATKISLTLDFNKHFVGEFGTVWFAA
jgi:hypothetical protein